MSDVFRTIVDMTDDRDAWKARAVTAEAEVAALRESIAADKRAGDYFVRKGMERALEIASNSYTHNEAVAAIRAAIRHD